MCANVWDVLASIAACISALITLIGIPILIYQIRGAKKALNTTAGLGLFGSWMSREMGDKVLKCGQKIVLPRRRGEWETFDDFKEKFGEDQEAMSLVREICDFCEHLGVLVRYAGLDIKLVSAYWGGVVIIYWEAFENVILGWRDETKRPIYEHFQDLYRKLRALNIRTGCPLVYNDETATTGTRPVKPADNIEP